MKKNWKALVAFCLLILVNGCTTPGEPLYSNLTVARNEAVVDLRKALHDIEEGQDAQKKIDAKSSEMQKSLSKKKQLADQSGDARIQKEYRQELKTYQEQINAYEESLSDPIFSRLKAVIAKIGEREKYSQILFSSEKISYSTLKDITSEVVLEYNQIYSKK